MEIFDRVKSMVGIGQPTLTITDVLNQGLHEFLIDVQSTLAAISDEVAAATMFYPAESLLEDQQQQQQQARATGEGPSRENPTYRGAGMPRPR